MMIGINLFSLRTLIKSENDFLATALRLKEMGYQCLQYSGGPYEPDRLRRVSRASGLPITVTHVPMDRILNDTDTLMKEHEGFGCRYIGLGTMDRAVIADGERVRRTVEELNRVAERMERNGFTFFYHNHHPECYKHGDKTVLDMFIDDAPSVHVILDTYWLQYGGVSIMETVERLKGRIECVHLKDYRIKLRTEEDKFIYEPTFAPVGDGNINFAAIIPAMMASGTKYFLVEQDNAVSFDDPFKEVERSIIHLKKLIKEE